MTEHFRAIGYLLGSLRELQAINVHFQRVTAAQQACYDTIPAPLKRWTRVGYESPDVLLLIADSAAVAARLRQLSPRILADVKHACPEVSEVRIRVQALRREPARTRIERRVPATALTNLEELAQHTEHVSLRDALRKLIVRQRRQT